MQFSKEFKEALAGLPNKEKDKLILRLLKKDLNLANRLLFELVDNATVDDKRTQMENRVKQQVLYFSERYYSPGYLMMDLRYLSGEITEHVRITKDKFGEITLNLLMLNDVLDLAFKKTLSAAPSNQRKLVLYIIARAFKLLLLIRKTHEDYHLDFEPQIVQLGKSIGKHDVLIKTAIHHGLDVNWLIGFDIPEDIEEIHQDLRQRGYLK